jgi:lipoate-protein ligase B
MFFSDWGLIPYAEAWQRQTEWFDSLIQAKQNNDVYENHIVFCEHPHVYTLGRSGKENNMLLSEAQLEKIGATLYHIDRGGDITYHGPGQLVCYPILNLEEFGLGLSTCICWKRRLSACVPLMESRREGWQKPPVCGWKEILPGHARFVRSE